MPLYWWSSWGALLILVRLPAGVWENEPILPLPRPPSNRKFLRGRNKDRNRESGGNRGSADPKGLPAVV